MPSLRKSSRTSLVVSTGAALALVATTPALVAQADPIYPSAKQVQDAKAAANDKAADVAAAEGELASSSARLAQVQTAAEIAAERYNGARVLLQERTDAARAAAERAGAARRAADAAGDKVGQLAAAAYVQGGSLGGLEAFLSSKGPEDVIDRASGIALVSEIRGQAAQEASATLVVAGVLQRQAAHARAKQVAATQAADKARAQAQAATDFAAAETASIQHRQSTLVSQLATFRNTSVALEQRRQAGLRAEAQARAAAAARAAADARAAAERRASAAAARRQAAARAASEAVQRVRAGQQARRSAHGSRPSPKPSRPRPSRPTPPRGGVGSVIAFAQAQLGEMYLWGGAGPDRWDCSGLTMKAWAQAGTYLSHYTGSQWAQTRHLPISERRPGDLIFFGSSGAASHHVGLYVGGDQMIEAARSGTPVRYAGIWRGDIVMTVGRP